jgi:enolase
MNNKIILKFLDTFCESVNKNESESYVELMMDDHICILYKNKSYYVPKNNSFYTKEDVKIYKYLENNFKF